MVDMTILSTLHGSPAAARRVRTRKMAQWRLQAYGIGAILIAAGSLVVLLWSVFAKASLVVTETYLRLPVTISADQVPADNPRAGNFDALRRAAVQAVFPEVSGRSERRALADLISLGGALDLQRAVERDPSLIGQTITFDFLASDDIDLYAKGEFGELEVRPALGTLSMVVTDGSIELFTGANNFDRILGEIKDSLQDRAELLRRQAALQENGRRVTDERIAELPPGPERDALAAQAEKFAAERDRILDEVGRLETRVRAPGGRETIDATVQSLFVRVHGGWVKVTEVTPSDLKGTIVRPLASTEPAAEGTWSVLVNEVPEEARKVSDLQLVWMEELRERGAVVSAFNWRFLSAADSREAELAGMWGAIVGSFWTMLVTFSLAFPIGVLAAIYLEEFAPKNWFTDLIEVSINNLAAVPSIVFGLLGLAVFIDFFGVPRSSALVGGLVLALVTLPIIIIASRAAIKAVPPSIRDAALGIGASKLQTSFHHVVPLAMPGILTGTIVGMAQALGDTAPLIMIGMVAFILDIPGGVTDAATVIPVQVFRWSDFPERAFEAKTAAAIVVLLVFLVLMNALAIFLRKRFERRW